jgi:hypothetical protein
MPKQDRWTLLEPRIWIICARSRRTGWERVLYGHFGRTEAQHFLAELQRLPSHVDYWIEQLPLREIPRPYQVREDEKS